LILTKQHFADVADRVARDELTPGEAYRLLGRIQRDQEGTRRITAEDRLEMVRLYVDERVSAETIAKVLKCAEATVRHHLESVGVELRTRSDAASPRTKLSDDDVCEIRASGDPQIALARRFGVSPSRISAIKNRTSRANVLDVELLPGLEGKRQVLNLLPTHNEAAQAGLRSAAKHTEATRQLLRTVANTAPSE
jgi:hypothetical protein